MIDESVRLVRSALVDKSTRVHQIVLLVPVDIAVGWWYGWEVKGGGSSLDRSLEHHYAIAKLGRVGDRLTCLGSWLVHTSLVKCLCIV